MRLLTTNNTSINMNALPDKIISDLRYVVDLNMSLPDKKNELKYCVLDYSDPKGEIDFFFIPLVYLDQFPRPSADLRIGPYRIQMPLDWSIVIADKNSGAMEVVELKHINDRPFTAFVMNPINGFMPAFEEIIIENIFPDIMWTMPKLKYGHILAIPLTDKPNPPCALLLKDVNRLPESLDLTKIF